MSGMLKGQRKSRCSTSRKPAFSTFAHSDIPSRSHSLTHSRSGFESYPKAMPEDADAIDACHRHRPPGTYLAQHGSGQKVRQAAHVESAASMAVQDIRQTNHLQLKKGGWNARRLWRKCSSLLDAAGAFRQQGKKRSETTKNMAAKQQNSTPNEVSTQALADATASNGPTPTVPLRGASSFEAGPRGSQEHAPQLSEILAHALAERQPRDGIQPLALSAQGPTSNATGTGSLFPETHTANIGGGSWYAASTITVIQNIYVGGPSDNRDMHPCCYGPR